MLGGSASSHKNNTESHHSYLPIEKQDRAIKGIRSGITTVRCREKRDSLSRERRSAQKAERRKFLLGPSA